MSGDFCIRCGEYRTTAGCGCDRILKELEGERDRYKKALEEILIEALKSDPYRSWDNLFNIAKEALRDENNN